MKISRLLVSILVPVVLCTAGFAQTGSKSADSKYSLNDGWALQSSTKVSEKGEAIASLSFQPKDWIKANVPSTVVAAQVKTGVLPDPFDVMNLGNTRACRIPSAPTSQFTHASGRSPYAVSWWYRKEFTLPKDFAGKTVWLNFQGINYRRNIWLNGKQIANSDQVAGAWRTTTSLIVTSAVKAGANVVAAQIWAPTDAVSPSLS
jgi:exo-1,4-beta-D-glucosaminidase